MENVQKTVYVYDDWSSSAPRLMGKLCAQRVRGEEVFSFEYDESWLREQPRIILDPDLRLYAGKQYLLDGKRQFGIFLDSEPDRWGRTLLKRREENLANKENRKPKSLSEIDFLLGVDDSTRVGAIRFKESPDGLFLAPSSEFSVPPMKRLRELETASLKYEEGDVADEEWMNILLAPGSSLGGARPKANVLDEEGNLWIAKFPSKHDVYDAGAWEFVAHELAKMCGLNVPEARLCKFSNQGSTFLVKRFDRDGEGRIHFSSAMTMLGKQDGESSEASYADIATFLRANGARPKQDVQELWKRVVFSVLIKNTDDHLRNHGFLLSELGWNLSPMYDVNPDPYGNHLSLGILGDECSLNADYLVAVSSGFLMRLDEAASFVEKAREIISANWIKLAKQNGISDVSIAHMKNAFIE